MTVQPIIIVGAPRSGTNILRDVLTADKSMTTWPCDEINYIWRYGNRDKAHDELIPEDASPAIRSYVERAFRSQAARGNTPMVVEKTCATSLRVQFVDAILPSAIFVSIERNPIDAIASAMQRWRAPLDLRYVVKKARWVPRRDIPHYATRYLAALMSRRRDEEERLPTWGPRFLDIDKSVQTDPLHLICAKQWRACVQSSRSQLAEIEPSRVMRVTYEEMATQPAGTFARLSEQLLGRSSHAIIAASGQLREDSIGRGSQLLSADQLSEISAIVDDMSGE